jgi:hypothetical protein
MDARDLLLDGFDRVGALYADLAAGLDRAALHDRPQGRGNPIGWLLWHTARVQDDHLADLAGTPQLWETWQERLRMPQGTDDIGYGHTSEQVSRVRIEDAGLLAEYHAQVQEGTLCYLERVDAEELDRVVDRRWDPPVTAGVRLVSVLGDCLQHLGQVGYLKGLREG